jgi:hypothetical protein
MEWYETLRQSTPFVECEDAIFVAVYDVFQEKVKR